MALPGVANENPANPADLCIPHSLETTAHPSTAQPSANKRIFSSEKDVRKHCKDHYWQCWNSAVTRLYYRCMGKKCEVKFTAKKSTDNDDTWFVENMPTCHSCSASATPQVASSLLTLKDHLSEAHVKEIEHLGMSKSFRSKQIQSHLLHHDKVLVDTKLIHNIVYRVRQKMFGHNADMLYLLEQQKVALLSLCTQTLLP